jgi:hypothetical protein
LGIEAETEEMLVIVGLRHTYQFPSRAC